MKDRLRKELIKKRKSLTKTEVLAKSNQIKKRLFELNEFKQSSVVLFYVSYDNEVYTHDMIKECMKTRKNISVPVSDKEQRRLILSELKNWNDLEPGSYGILEPKKDKIKEIPIESIDIIIIPGVGFDELGCRIGHGAGYYDNLLKESTNALHIGLAFEIQIVEKIPIESHDIPVDKILTEKRMIEC
jgi:5-formyltetrahydrofolate cyclo-ligase